MTRPGVVGILLFLLILSSPAQGKVLTTDTTWSGEVLLEEDLLIPEGVTLTVSSGANIRVAASDSTKTDPEFMSPLTEIMVRGTLKVDGKEGARVVFFLDGEKKSSWAGIIIDGGRAVLTSSTVNDAETGVYILRGSFSMTNSLLAKNRYGLTVQGRDAVVELVSSKITENDYGLLLMNGGRVENKETVASGNRKKDSFSSEARDYHSQVNEYAAKEKDVVRIFGDEVILGTAVWQKRVQVRGVVRVPENSRLIILPGTVVEFRKKDTNNDGIGENGLLVQGVLIAKGSRENPIILRSAEKQRKMGDWDAINIMNSDASGNLIEHCQIEDAYRGLHFHFSNVTVADSVLRNTYRGMQFQESVVEVRGTHFYANKSALQARDSDVVFTDNIVYRNYAGINTFRNNITLSGNLIVNNYLEGLRVREGVPVVERNHIDGNRHGITVTGGSYGIYGSNVISHNLESGISLKGTEGIEISGNVIQGSGINGLNVQDSSAVIRGNLISDNGERGVGILSFHGQITGNNILGNGLYNLGIDGTGDVQATMNWWGPGDVRKTIFDKENDPAKGRAEYLPMSETPFVFTWPLPVVRADASWRGDVLAAGAVAVNPGVNLLIHPDTKVLFAKGAGLSVKGKILARGEEKAGIIFTSFDNGGPGEWDEILLDQAVGSVFSNCRFEHATWALHSHFTDLRVEDCSFDGNGGGLRFTSGPIEVRRSLFSGNDIGIRAFRGSALITENIISGNKVGIFVREKGSGLTIKRNNFSANSDYAIRLGDFNTEDVDARDNWWGGVAAADSTYDAGKEPGIGAVLFEPVAGKPFQIKSPEAIFRGKPVSPRQTKEGEGKQ